MGNALGHLHKTERQSYVAVISGVKIRSLTELVCRLLLHTFDVKIYATRGPWRSEILQSVL